MDTAATSAPELPREPKLLVRSGPARGRVLALVGERVTIGRDERSDIRLDDDTVSGLHAVIDRDGEGRFWIEDHGSKNGTFLEGRRVARAELRDGDRFSLCRGGLEIAFLTGEPDLSSLLEESTRTLLRTGSLAGAIRELIPAISPERSRAVSIRESSVRELLNYTLEEGTRRTRIYCAASAGAFFLLSAAALLLVVSLRLDGDRPPLAGAPESGGAARTSVELDVKLEPIYGSLFLSYRDRPLGEARVVNRGASPLAGLALRFTLDDPAGGLLVEPFAAQLEELAPGASATVPIAPKLSTRILSDYTRETATRVTLSSRGEILAEASRAVFIYGRHVFNWEVPERIAAFIDPDDPAVAALVEAAWPLRPETERRELPPGNVVGALTVLGAVAELGLRYLPDARNPISARADWKANDRVHAPLQTVLAGTGDCDDLAVLCASVLERAGIPTLFAVGSSHVFLLFDAGVPAGALEESAWDPETVIVREGRVWLPVEATDLARSGATFARAWAAGWTRREAVLAGEFELVEVREAWSRYQPLPSPPGAALLEELEARVAVPAAFGERLRGELVTLRARFRENLDQRAAAIARAEGDGREGRRALARLYARSGLFAEAASVLEALLSGSSPGGGTGGTGGTGGAGGAEHGALAGESSRPSGDDAAVLFELTVCLALSGDLERAALSGEAALEGLPADAALERGEVSLRLALVHRLRGDLAAEKVHLEGALRLDPSLSSVYRSLLESDGTVSGREAPLRAYLLAALRAPGSQEG
jgi:pSer/pThr/pTyr-binding forkhead associated (FHA) protein